MANVKWSYSSLKKFTTCPRQYNEVKIKKNFVEKDTYDTIFGKEVHKALEDYVNKGVPLATNYRQYQKYLDAVIAIPGTKYPELKLALKADKTPCDFDDPEYWVRGIGDLLIKDGDQGFYVDYKTGKSTYADTKQLKLMALMMFAHYPEINNIKAGLLYVSKNTMIDEEYHRENIEAMWWSFNGDLRRLEHSLEKNWWPENPSGLCRKHCVVTTCNFNGKG